MLALTVRGDPEIQVSVGARNGRVGLDVPREFELPRDKEPSIDVPVRFLDGCQGIASRSTIALDIAQVNNSRVRWQLLAQERPRDRARRSVATMSAASRQAPAGRNSGSGR